MPVRPLMAQQSAASSSDAPPPASAMQDPAPAPPAEEVEARKAQPMPAPKYPSLEEIEAHTITHIPYRTWCRWCVMGRRPNMPHRSRNSVWDREIPILVGDYCFVRSIADDALQTIFVGRIYPFQAIIAIPCSAKGSFDEYAISRLMEVDKSTGVKTLVICQIERDLCAASLRQL